MVSLEPHRRNLYFSAISANLLYVSVGCAFAWPSSAIPLLRKNGVPPTQETWVVSLLMLGSCLGPTIYSSSIDRFGRKYSLLLTGIIFLISWIILGASDGVYYLYVGRFIGGLAVGSTYNCIPVYISEISDVKMRQTLTSCTEIFIGFGCLIQYAAGPWLTYRLLALVSAVPILIFGLALIRIPESPYHLMLQDKKLEAFETLVWLRSANQSLSEELDQIEKSVKESKIQTGRRIDLIKKRGPRRALFLSILMFIVLHFTAKAVLASYLGPILADTSIPISSKTATAIVGAMQWIFGIFEPFVVHKYGSKWALVICSFFCAFFLLSFGVYKHFDERHYKMSSYSALPIASIILFDFFYELGVGCLPWAISVELFPPSLKGFAINVVTTISWIVDFVVLTLYGDLSPVVGASACFIFFSVALIVGTIFIGIFVPNTKGRALHTIHDNLEQS